MTAWLNPADQMPPLHQQILVELKDGPGQVCDVACYVGRQENEDRWVLADVRLDIRGIRRWAHIHPEPPKNEVKRAFDEGYLAAMRYIAHVEGCTYYVPARHETAWQEYNR